MLTDDWLSFPKNSILSEGRLFDFFKSTFFFAISFSSFATKIIGLFSNDTSTALLTVLGILKFNLGSFRSLGTFFNLVILFNLDV